MDNKDRPRQTFAEVPIPYAPGSVNWQTAASMPMLTSGPGDFSANNEGLPVAILSRAIHFRGKWTGTPRKRMIRFFTLLYIKQGSGMLTINNAKVALDGPKLLLLAPGMHVVERTDGHADWDVHYIAFKLLRATRLNREWSLEDLEQPPFLRGGEVPVADLPLLERLIHRLHDQEDIDKNMLRWKRQLALSELLYAIMLEQKKQNTDSATEAVHRCAAYIDRHYAETIRMDKLAEWCGLHPSTFSRQFRQTIGLSPSDYLTKARIDAAKTMLAPSLPLRQVARQVGFCDEYYFSRMFKKTTGLPPSVYVRTVGKSAKDKEAGGRPLEPVNIAVTYIDEVDHLISLGLLPAAVPADRLPDGSETTIPYLSSYIAHLPHIGCEYRLDLALLRKLNPDTIIAGAFMRDWGITGFENIAPTHHYMWEVDWRNVHRGLAATLGQEARGEQNIAGFDRLVRSARDRMLAACARKTFVFMESTSEGVRISPYMSNGGWLLYQQLGLSPASIVSVNGWQHFVSPEEAASIKADYFFVAQRSGAALVHQQLLAEPGMQKLGHRLIELPRYPWSKGGPLAFSQGVKQILSIFAKLHK